MPDPAFDTPIDPASGDILGASQTNVWARDIDYLHGRATASYEPFSGVQGRSVDFWPYSAENEMWRGWFVYRGQTKIYNQIKCLTETVRIYASNDAGDYLLETLAAPATATSPYTLTGAYTVGKVYYLRVTVQNTAGSRAECRVDYAYALASNAYTWIAPPSTPDGNTNLVADWTTLTNNANYAKTVIEQPQGMFKALITPAPPNTPTLYNCWWGSFVHKALNTLNLDVSLAGNGNGAMVLHISDIGGTNDRSVASIVQGQSFPTTIDLTTVSPALSAGTRYLIWFTQQELGGGRPNATIAKIFFTGTRALSAPISRRWQVSDFVYGNTTTVQVARMHTSLSDIRSFSEYQTIGGVDYGVQYLSSDYQSHYYMGFDTTLYFRRSHKLRWLWYQVITTGTAGQLQYGKEIIGLPDVNGDGTTSILDLSSLTLLPLGFFYTVTGVKFCFESPTAT